MTTWKEPHFEIVRTDAEQPWHARWVAGNGQTVWVTENYVDRGDALHAIELLPRGVDWLISYTPLDVDERESADYTDTPAEDAGFVDGVEDEPTADPSYDMNAE